MAGIVRTEIENSATGTSGADDLDGLEAAFSHTRLGGAPSAGSTAPESAEPASGASTVPAAKATPKRRVSGAPTRFYCITRVPSEHEHRLGIHRGTWGEVSKLLPDRRLPGSGYHLRGFDTEEAAAAYWVSEGWEAPAPVHYG